jgi:hypothetical protein
MAGGVGPYGAIQYGERTPFSPNGDAEVAAGGGARLRVGVGRRQEVGIEAAGAYPGTFAAAVRWKIALRDWAAIVASVGGIARERSGPAMGTDLSFVFSSTGPKAQVYGGPRLAFSTALTDVLLTEALILPVGAWIPVHPIVALYVEGGATFALSQAGRNNGPHIDYAVFGGYAAFGVNITARRAQ